jgi:hypothetical protein
VIRRMVGRGKETRMRSGVESCGGAMVNLGMLEG